MPVAVASGIGGIQFASTTSWTRASAGSRTSWTNAAIDSASAVAIDPHATAAAAARLNQRMPTRPMSAAPAAGTSGMSQMKSTLPTTA